MSQTTPYWFYETALPYGRPGIQIGVQVTEKIYEGDSDYSHIEVLQTPFYGKMLVIDGIIQTTEYDESIYHEMMITAAAIQHGNPKSILIIGGGDGGAAKQSLRIKSLEKIVQVEIDEGVINASETYMPSISKGALRDPRVELIVGDGLKYFEESTEKFDIIALDLTDPLEDSPAEALFDTPFYQLVKDHLADDGVVSVQSGSIMFQPDEVRILQDRLKNVFGHTIVRSAVMPGYQLSTFAFQYATFNEAKNLSLEDIEKRFENIEGTNKYLTPQVYAAASAISPFYV